jgi:hypothetical protein
VLTNTFSFQLSIGASVLCLPWLRWAQPNLPRPIRVNLIFPVVYLIATIFVTVVPMYASPRDTGYGILMILTSIPVYALFIAWRNKPKWFIRMMGKFMRHTGWAGTHADTRIFDIENTPLHCFFRRIHAKSTKTNDGCSTKEHCKGFYFVFCFLFFN